MNSRMKLPLVASIALVSAGLSAGLQAQQTGMTFFVTSVGSGKGADLGGLAGADAQCQLLAAAAGVARESGGGWQPHLARLPERQCERRGSGGQCP